MANPATPASCSCGSPAVVTVIGPGGSIPLCTLEAIALLGRVDSGEITATMMIEPVPAPTP